MYGLIPISALRAGETAIVRQLVGPPEQVRRLEELGLRSGALLEMVRGGTPCIVRLGAAKLCLRHGELLGVMVAPRMSA